MWIGINILMNIVCRNIKYVPSLPSIITVPNNNYKLVWVEYTVCLDQLHCNTTETANYFSTTHRLLFSNLFYIYPSGTQNLIEYPHSRHILLTLENQITVVSSEINLLTQPPYIYLLHQATLSSTVIVYIQNIPKEFTSKQLHN